ncbi:hypothetical protein V8F20_006781 [Naviculisporaceae sp. PSN 640]
MRTITSTNQPKPPLAGNSPSPASSSQLAKKKPRPNFSTGNYDTMTKIELPPNVPSGERKTIPHPRVRQGGREGLPAEVPTNELSATLLAVTTAGITCLLILLPFLPWFSAGGGEGKRESNLDILVCGFWILLHLVLALTVGRLLMSQARLRRVFINRMRESKDNFMAMYHNPVVRRYVVFTAFGTLLGFYVGYTAAGYDRSCAALDPADGTSGGNGGSVNEAVPGGVVPLVRITPDIVVVQVPVAPRPRTTPVPRSDDLPVPRPQNPLRQGHFEPQPLDLAEPIQRHCIQRRSIMPRRYAIRNRPRWGRIESRPRWGRPKQARAVRRRPGGLIRRKLVRMLRGH